MSVDIRSSDRRRYMNELQAREKEIAAGLLKVSQPSSPKVQQETEKRIRREIANSNERRRMQCINAGFSSLRALIPQLEGEKLSKAAILQHATEYITSLEKDKSRLQQQLEHTRGLLSELGQDRTVADTYVSSSPPPSKRKKRDTESSDEGVGSLSDGSDDGGSELQHENVTLRHQLEMERQRCATFEERNHILEAQLLAVLQVQAAHPSSLGELRPVSLDHRQLRDEESLYTREVVEVIASREKIAPSPRYDSFHPPRPLSPSPEQRLDQEVSVPLDATTHRSIVIDNPRYYPAAGEPVSPALKMEVVPVNETSAHVGVPCVSPMGGVTTASVTPSNSSTVLTTADQSSRHHHNYCHRDHPRRRHRQQAQLEQQRAEEELRRQQQEAAAQTPVLPRPKSGAQNLENLVEAIRQIEGDRVLCKFYEDKHILFEKCQNGPNADESERETSSVSDQDEPKSESSGRDSPLLHHHHHQLQHQQNISSINSISHNNVSRFSEKYPIATHLLHRPLHPSCYRPGVIVHKQ